MSIPVFHDDQHGTAIISAAAILNALKVTGKNIGEVKVVCSGAGAAAISCLNLWCDLGVKRENITVCDSKGVIYAGRDADMEPTKARYARETEARTLADALDGADVFLGLSAAGASSRRCSPAWPSSRSFSLWPIRRRKSCPSWPARCVPT
jgi:malate dehydrogenase (oxaloacetate-decarboxylating)(NADP+)